MRRPEQAARPRGLAQWTVPIVLGLAAAGLTWVAAPDEIPRAPGAAEVRDLPPYVLVPFVDHDARLLRYNATGQAHGLGGILDVHAGRAVNGVFWWDGNGWECHRPGVHCQARLVEPMPIPARQGAGHGGQEPVDGAAPAPGAPQDIPSASGAPGGAAGNGSTQAAVVSQANSTLELTFFAFTSNGHLLATNAPRSQWESYDLHGQFTHFSSRIWHLGPGTAPDGARTLPMFRAEAFGVLEGTPMGGVQSTVLEAHPYDWLVGPVWLTARVEGLASV